MNGEIKDVMFLDDSDIVWIINMSFLNLRIYGNV